MLSLASEDDYAAHNKSTTSTTRRELHFSQNRFSGSGVDDGSGLGWIWICSTSSIWRSHRICQSRQCPVPGSRAALWWFGWFWCLPDITRSQKYLGVFSCIWDTCCYHGKEILQLTQNHSSWSYRWSECPDAGKTRSQNATETSAIVIPKQKSLSAFIQI